MLEKHIYFLLSVALITDIFISEYKVRAKLADFLKYIAPSAISYAAFGNNQPETVITVIKLFNNWIQTYRLGQMM